eukprot:Protomagalhaensia_sp_Gyna_25__1341@NODE_1674_length_1635_cov_9_036967_g1269_i1_p1_GENE_NODE_1674_length_1635_cov_9_036967_g1269_i1NODE_1674_length_1635_cov_9_036967_g1269_i1_p1_ORF_typecomplete_len247_score25_06PIPLCX/PF00388_19/3_1e10EFhand_like/PF09279_11/1_7e04EFhand_like/PF09279_11/1_1e07EFhand_like/PF09279_11/1_6e04EFhand_10/PF14788_6/0_31EFhand_10/PF14788_6/1e04_NODE_1674_length_1635_cov_9_036967_g1269_i1111851
MSMYFDALLNLLCAIGVVADCRYVWELFETFNVDGSSNIDFDELMPMLECLFTHHDVLTLFDTYAEGSRLMSEAGLICFLRDVQQASALEIDNTLEFVKHLKEPFVKESQLTHIGFCYLLTTKTNTILNPTRSALHQDMNRPFTDYWVSTVAFTDVENVRFGLTRSPRDLLKDVLLQGIRCVHLNVVDGKDDEPWILLESDTRFTAKDALQVIKRWAFRSTPYPFILSQVPAESLPVVYARRSCCE